MANVTRLTALGTRLARAAAAVGLAVVLLVVELMHRVVVAVAGFGAGVAVDLGVGTAPSRWRVIEVVSWPVRAVRWVLARVGAGIAGVVGPVAATTGRGVRRLDRARARVGVDGRGER